MRNKPFINDFIETCLRGSNLGWHERNGGNLSYRLSEEDIQSVQDQFQKSLWQDLDITASNLANDYFLVSGSGKYFMNMDKNISESMGIVELNEQGNQYRIVWGFENNNRPTSELPSHLLNHAVKKEQTDQTHRIIYHAHTTNIIALTFVLPLSDEAFTRKLWEMATECPVVFPQGVGVLPWMVPGGKEIALATSQKMAIYDAVIWAHHGIFCSGTSFEETFGLMHTIEKAAEVLVKVLSMSSEPLNTIQKEDFLSLETPFKITLNKILLK